MNLFFNVLFLFHSYQHGCDDSSIKVPFLQQQQKRKKKSILCVKFHNLKKSWLHFPLLFFFFFFSFWFLKINLWNYGCANKFTWQKFSSVDQHILQFNDQTAQTGACMNLSINCEYHRKAMLVQTPETILLFSSFPETASPFQSY